MKKIALILVSIFILSCSQDDSNEVSIRVKNTSQFEYIDIVVGQQNYGTISSNESSNYKQFDIAYRYNFIELKIDGETFTIQPIDYVGETPLQNGKYTYEVNANDSNEQYSRLSLTLVEN